MEDREIEESFIGVTSIVDKNFSVDSSVFDTEKAVVVYRKFFK